MRGEGRLRPDPTLFAEPCWGGAYVPCRGGDADSTRLDATWTAWLRARLGFARPPWEGRSSCPAPATVAGGSFRGVAVRGSPRARATRIAGRFGGCLDRRERVGGVPSMSLWRRSRRSRGDSGPSGDLFSRMPGGCSFRRFAGGLCKRAVGYGSFGSSEGSVLGVWQLVPCVPPIPLLRARR